MSEAQNFDDVRSPIIQGRTYEFIGEGKWKGHRYKVLLASMLSVPERTSKVLVEALTGEDTGLLFCCTPWHFVVRYCLVEEETTKAASGGEPSGAS